MIKDRDRSIFSILKEKIDITNEWIVSHLKENLLFDTENILLRHFQTLQVRQALLKIIGKDFCIWRSTDDMAAKPHQIGANERILGLFSPIIIGQQLMHEASVIRKEQRKLAARLYVCEEELIGAAIKG